MPRKKKEDKDERMIADYFKHLDKYQNEFGIKTILLWQCGGFYEIYSPKNEETDEYLKKTLADKKKALKEIEDAKKNKPKKKSAKKAHSRLKNIGKGKK